MRKYNRYEPGQRFGRLTLVERMPGGQKWRCICDCGDEVITQIAGGAKSCKSCAYKNRPILHGHNRKNAPDRIYRIWIGMKSRCHNSNDTTYHYYGGRSILVCDEWKNDFMSFYSWAMANGYTDDLSIDRIDVNGNYEPSNCQWITMKKQANNKSDNRFIEFNGEKITLQEAAERSGIARETIARRLNDGWSVGDALTIEPKIGRNQYDKIHT